MNQTSDLPVLDAQILADFIAGQAKDFPTYFVPQFQEMTRYRLTSASRAAEEGNWAAVAGSIGEMGSEAGSLGLLRWEAQCRKIEALCADGRTDEVGKLIGGLQDYCLEGVDAVRRFAKTGSI